MNISGFLSGEIFYLFIYLSIYLSYKTCMLSRFYLFIWPHCEACGILIPWPGIKPVPPAVEVWCLNHWTAREVPGEIFYLLLLFFNKFILFIYFWLHWVFIGCVRAFSSCGERGLLFVAVHGLLVEWLLLLRSTGSRRAGFSSCSTRAQ